MPNTPFRSLVLDLAGRFAPGDIIVSDELPALEKFVRWHYELAINHEGIEALSHMLQRVERLLDENRTLRNRLRRFEPGNPDVSTADFAEL